MQVLKLHYNTMYIHLQVSHRGSADYVTGVEMATQTPGVQVRHSRRGVDMSTQTPGVQLRHLNTPAPIPSPSTCTAATLDPDTPPTEGTADFETTETHWDDAWYASCEMDDDTIFQVSI